ncbi:putative membrane protein [Lyngbya aestuarii BL J]|uniref:Putative membrane protein n=2 Tax=Lyngbya aestuarii TaxID=118322 RepID=U7QMB5_9CYAN|nr:putative membrane protein [Lyngbya aestuarii BL J]
MIDEQYSGEQSMTWRGETTIRDRIFSALPYLLPLMYGLEFSRFLFAQFPILTIILIPLAPLISIYQTVPFIGLVIFFALFLLVVRNQNIPHFIRFNTMQAILLDIIIVLCSIILGILGGGLQGFILETIYNMLFLGILAAVIYSVVQSLRGHYAEIPTISDAVYMQVP